MLNTEIWKKIDDLPYEVSNFGTVRRDPKSKYNQKAKICNSMVILQILVKCPTTNEQTQ